MLSKRLSSEITFFLVPVPYVEAGAWMNEGMVESGHREPRMCLLA